MRAVLADFLDALRERELAVSPAEAIDAHQAAAAIGVGDKALLKDALAACLAKSAEDTARFDACFEAFFARAPISLGVAAAMTAPPGAPPLAALLLSGDAAALAQAMEEAAHATGATEIRLAAQRPLAARRMLDRMGLRALEAWLRRAPDGELAQAVAERRLEIMREARAFVDRQAEIRAPDHARRLRERLLARRAFAAIEPEDLRAMEALTRKMAKRLARRFARRRHASRKGRLDVRRTIRRSLAYGGVPFEVIWRRRILERPKVMVLCDVSRSVAAAAQFLLLFLYCLKSVIQRLDAFAFSDRLVAVDDVLKEETVDDAIALILERIGFRPTDYGRSLADFFALTGDKIDRRTTVIVVGDGRTNFADPRLDLARRMAERARAVVWLNPEPRSYWGQGDSRMEAYARFCTVAVTCNSLAGLERVIEDVLRTYLPR